MKPESDYPDKAQLLAAAIDKGADPNWIQFHSIQAENRQSETGIPLIELEISEGELGVKEIQIGKDEEYIIPKPLIFSPFIETSRNNIENLRLRASLLTTSVSMRLRDDPSVTPTITPGGVFKYLKTKESPWGNLTVVYNDDPKPEDENVVVSITENLPDENGEPSQVTTFKATLFDNKRFNIREFRGNTVSAQAQYTSDQRQSFTTDTHRLMKKTEAIIGFFLNDRDHEE